MTTPSTQPWRDPLPSSSSPRPRRLSSTPPLPGPSTSESTPKKPALVLLASSPSPTPSLSPLYSPSDESFAPSRPESPASPAFITTLEDVPDPRPSALLAPVRGLRALARVCAGGGAVAYAAARRRRRLDGDPDVDGDLGGSRGRDTAGWRSARPAEEGHTVQVLVGGRVSPALSYGSRPSGEWRPSMEERVSFERSSMDGREWMEERRPSFVEESVEGSVEGYTVDGSEASATPSTSVMSSSPAAIQEGQSGFRWPWSAASSSLEEGERPAPFAAEVAIKGWQVVGGKSWDDSAKVGAYVVYDIEIALRNGTTLSITRRYTEFVRLRDTLRRAYPLTPASATHNPCTAWQESHAQVLSRVPRRTPSSPAALSSHRRPSPRNGAREWRSFAMGSWRAQWATRTAQQRATRLDASKPTWLGTTRANIESTHDIVMMFALFRESDSLPFSKLVMTFRGTGARRGAATDRVHGLASWPPMRLEPEA
ncbi:unnamed protein product [Cutaneotrichosporon oleaginosum]